MTIPVTGSNGYSEDLNIYNHLNIDPAMKNKINENNPTGIKQKKTLGVEECETCENRRYQDGSDDPGVSFKSPTKLPPSVAATAVINHEREHYSRESSKAEQDGKEVLQNTISIFTSVCPECGKTYVSGGETRTVTRAKAEKADFAKQFFEDTVGKYTARMVDKKI